MKALLLAGVLAVGLGPVLAEAAPRAVMHDSMVRKKFKGGSIMVHKMTMADGTVIFGMSQSDLDKVLNWRGYNNGR